MASKIRQLLQSLNGYEVDTFQNREVSEISDLNGFSSRLSETRFHVTTISL